MVNNTTISFQTKRPCNSSNSAFGMTVLKTTFQNFRIQLEIDKMSLRSPSYFLNRRLSMRPSPEELEERNILKSK
jgi:hypothetical protein